MATELETPDNIEPVNPDTIGDIIINEAACPGCTSKVILFSRTIQTFCYRCGLPVTRLDPEGFYYEVIAPVQQQKESVTSV
ncbi:MAG TPA: hypothetical protein VH186_24825 [Chloroflexia bacterium]|nr:hypothetical protein [Chloroflexia bacterium]